MKYLNLIGLIFLTACGKETVVGVLGPQGSPGPSGRPGTSLVSTSVPALPSQCPNGGNTLLIAQDTEELGVWSPKDLDQTAITTCNGLDGQAGTPGTSVTTIQFCKGYQTNYPGTFPEFGIVIEGSIYAVYWSGSSAWLALIIPGRYTSTSNSSPCDFTVNNDGTVSN